MKQIFSCKFDSSLEVMALLNYLKLPMYRRSFEVVTADDEGDINCRLITEVITCNVLLHVYYSHHFSVNEIQQLSHYSAVSQILRIVQYLFLACVFSVCLCFLCRQTCFFAAIYFRTEIHRVLNIGERIQNYFYKIIFIAQLIIY